MMAYLVCTRYGLTKLKPADYPLLLRESGQWRQVWRHPSGLLVMRHPVAGYWVVADCLGYWSSESWSSSLRAAARSIERRAARERSDA
jgi:hypothetical protein